MVFCVFCISFCVVRLNRWVMNILIRVEISVVSSSVLIVSMLILFSDVVLLSLVIEFSIDISISGMMIICSSWI